MKPKAYIDIQGRALPVVPLSDANSQDLDGTSASAATAAALDAVDDCLVRIAAKADIYIAIGATPTAAAGDIWLPANGELWMEIPKGHKIAVLGGVANITKAG